MTRTFDAGSNEENVHAGLSVQSSMELRRDKLNSQFIVTKFSILHAGGRSLFRFQTNRETIGWLCSSSRSPEPRPLIKALEWVRPKDCIFIVLDLKSENFWQNLKIHAGGDDKL